MATDPTATVAAHIVEHQLGQPIVAVERLPTGLMNWVYWVRLSDGAEVVIRLNRPGNGAHFAAAVRWQDQLTSRGVPLPALLAHDANPRDGSPPYMIIARLPGHDLGEVYPKLTATQKQTIAEQIAAIQRAVGGLPIGPGYGFASGYDDTTLHPTWAAVLRADLARSRTRMATAGLVDPALADRVADQIAAHAAYFDSVPPTPFLDDTTTKNVLIHEGQLAGIVDVDCVCFGDPLFTVALTRMALLSRDFATDYIDYWCATLDLRAAQRAALDLYTALFCVGFLSEQGQRFNAATTLPAEECQIARLLTIWRDLMALL